MQILHLFASKMRKVGQHFQSKTPTEWAFSMRNGVNTELFYIEPYDIWFIKTKYNIGNYEDNYVDEFCDNCKIQSVFLYNIKSGQTILNIKYILVPEINIYNINLDLQKIDISYIFKRKWDADIYNVHCELFRKFSIKKIQDLHEDLMTSYWHIDNMSLWCNELSHKWENIG